MIRLLNVNGQLPLTAPKGRVNYLKPGMILEIQNGECVISTYGSGNVYVADDVIDGVNNTVKSTGLITMWGVSYFTFESDVFMLSKTSQRDNIYGTNFMNLYSNSGILSMSKVDKRQKPIAIGTMTGKSFAPKLKVHWFGGLSKEECINNMLMEEACL